MAAGDYPVRTSLCLQAVAALWVEDVAVHAEAGRGASWPMEVRRCTGARVLACGEALNRAVGDQARERVHACRQE